MANTSLIPLTDTPLIPLTQQPVDAPIPAEVPVASGFSALGSSTLWFVALIGILIIAAVIGIALRGGRAPRAPDTSARPLAES